jgi:hypothetical protein
VQKPPIDAADVEEVIARKRLDVRAAVEFVHAYRAVGLSFTFWASFPLVLARGNCVHDRLGQHMQRLHARVDFLERMGLHGLQVLLIVACVHGAQFHHNVGH